MTACDDNSVGETLPGSAGSPSGGYGGYAAAALVFLNGIETTMSHFRIAYAGTGIAYEPTANMGTNVLRDIQFERCAYGIFVDAYLNSCSVRLQNVLIDHAVIAVELVNAIGFAEHLTVNNSMYLTDGLWYPGAFFVTNSILANIDYLSSDGIPVYGSHNAFFNSPSFGANIFTNDTNPFQTVGGGNYYLADGSPLRGAGTTNISSELLQNLRLKTTYPPILLANTLLSSTDITLSPQAPRNTSIPDLGYHYDPLDFEFNHVYVTNAITLTIAPGTAIAAFGTNSIGYGLAAAYGATVISHGTPTQPVRFVEYSAVQESVPSGWLPPWYSLFTDDVLQGPGCPPGYFNFRFTDFSTLALMWGNFALEFSPGDVRDCQSHGGIFVMYDRSTVTNCLFERSYTDLSAVTGGGLETIRNSLFFGGTLMVYSTVSNSIVGDNLFDRTTIYGDFGWIGYQPGHNAYVTNCNRINPTNAYDIVLTNTDYRTGPLGRFYYPTNGGMLSRLINTGSTNADLLGLYHFTVMTNLVGGLQIKETNSVVDIGFHYVATDGYGNPQDADSDGLPDYFEDTTGDGVYNTGDLSSWLAPHTDDDGVSDYIEYLQGRNPRAGAISDTNNVIQLQVYTPLK